MSCEHILPSDMGYGREPGVDCLDPTERFVAVYEDGSVAALNVWKAGTDLDMADCLPPFRLFYNDAGMLYPVTLGPVHRWQDRCDDDLAYGTQDMIANGKVVGYVTLTDH